MDDGRIQRKLNGWENMAANLKMALYLKLNRFNSKYT